MSFEAITSNILKEAINSAIYIDDKVVLPYEQPSSSSEVFIPSEIYTSFRQNECSLDIYRYEGQSINDVEKFLYFNRDLLILDWHLDPKDDDNMKPTFGILTKAIKAKNLHFCVVYTSEKDTDLQEKVIYNIASYFSGLTTKLRDIARSSFMEYLDATGIDQAEIEKIIAELKKWTKELFFQFKDKVQNKAVSVAINDIINGFTKKSDFETFLASLSLPVNIYKEQLICLGFILNETETPDSAIPLKIDTPNSKNTIKINNLFIKAYSKGTSSTGLYDDFKQSLISESNLFLSLLGLELRNRFRENSGFIGKDLESVSHLAFFYHRKSHFDGHEELFNEFLKDIWKDQVGSFLLEKDITLFSVLNEFQEMAGVEEQLKNFNKSVEPNRNSLAQLNYVYNRLATTRKENDEIRFGDVFYFDIEGTLRTFLVCVTPHCDCLRPGKIKNMFFFIEGREIGITAGVDKSDGDYISYIKNDSAITCVDWTNGTDDCKPFSLYIPNNKMAGADRIIKASILGEERSLIYSTTLKENYAQRIANKAFFYPLRVGIDFASFKKTN